MEIDLATTIANAKLARSTAERWVELRKENLVSQQETDEKIGDAAAKDALRESARANAARLRELQGFKRIVAPFDGVITARNIDIGALVNAASGVALFRITASQTLRVYIQIPQNYAPSIKPETRMPMWDGTIAEAEYEPLMDYVLALGEAAR